MHFTNLFNGNEVLANNMNNFLNENSEDILAELKAPIIKGFGRQVNIFILYDNNQQSFLYRLFGVIINNIFNTFSYSDLFIED